MKIGVGNFASSVNSGDCWTGSLSLSVNSAVRYLCVASAGSSHPKVSTEADASISVRPTGDGAYWISSPLCVTPSVAITSPSMRNSTVAGRSAPVWLRSAVIVTVEVPASPPSGANDSQPASLRTLHAALAVTFTGLSSPAVMNSSDSGSVVSSGSKSLGFSVTWISRKRSMNQRLLASIVEPM